MALPLLSRLALYARHHYRRVFVVTAALFAVSVALASRLRFDTDVLDLLPRDEPVVDTFRKTLEELGSADYLILAVRVPPDAVLDPYEMFVDRLGQRLEQHELLTEVDYKIGDLREILETFIPQALLFLDRDDRARLVNRLTDEAVEARARELWRLLATPQALAVKSLIQLDPLGVSDIFMDRLTKSRAGLSIDWTSGYLLSQDRRMLLVLGKPVEPPLDLAFAKHLIAAVSREIEGVTAEWAEFARGEGSPPPEVALGGRYVITVGDERIIRQDALTNVVTSMAGVLLLFLFAFRRFGLLLYAFVPLSCGLALTFGFSKLVYGGLSAATSGVAALLVGLGIDFVIVSYGRFVEERKRGASLSEALATMNGSSGRAVVVGGVTSAATFYSFGVTDFTGLYQMGFLTGTGILLCMIAVLFLLPSMLAWSEDHHERRERYPRLFLHGFGSAHLIRQSMRHPRLVLILGVAVSLVAAWHVRDLRFDDSVQAMRPAGNPGVAVRDEVAERFGTGFDQMMLILEGDTIAETLELTERATAAAQRLVDEGVLTGEDSVSSLVPSPQRQAGALDWLREKRNAALDFRRVRATFFDAAAREGLRAEGFLPGLKLLERALLRDAPIRLEDFEKSPQAKALLERYLLPTEDGWKSVVYLHPPAKVWRRQPPPQVERLAEDLGPAAVLTGANVVSEFLRERVLRDAVVAAALGFVLVAALLLLDYRRIRDTALSLAPLTVGILWMLGAVSAFGLSMNFMNIFVTTMIIGIGVDYGIHMIHRYREMSGVGDERLAAGLVETGKAIVLAALSTTVGFGSLSISHYPGLQSMGKVAILGAVSTALVAITVLPAYIALRRGPALSKGV